MEHVELVNKLTLLKNKNTKRGLFSKISAAIVTFVLHVNISCLSLEYLTIFFYNTELKNPTCTTERSSRSASFFARQYTAVNKC